MIDRKPPRTKDTLASAANHPDPNERVRTSELSQEISPTGRDPARVDVPVDGRTPIRPPPVGGSNTGTDSVSTTARDLTMTTGLLLLLVPYALTVAFLLLAAGALRYASARSDTTPAQRTEDTVVPTASDGGYTRGEQ